MRALSSGATDPGRVRPNNEDSLLVLDALGLFAVADGVGGRRGGEVASDIAVETLRESVPDLLGAGDRTPPAGSVPGGRAGPLALRQAVFLANRRIRAAVEGKPELAGMGTTVTALLLTKGRAVIAHVGDSRAYLLRSGSFRQLTEDHTFVAEQVKAGLITPGEARLSAYRHVITRALGVQDDVAPDIIDRDAAAGDRFLLCSDGLTEMVGDREIAAILAAAEPEQAARRLIDAANAAGGVDNITAVVVKVLDS